jgi:hypothetical protein
MDQVIEPELARGGGTTVQGEQLLRDNADQWLSDVRKKKALSFSAARQAPRGTTDGAHDALKVAKSGLAEAAFGSELALKVRRLAFSAVTIAREGRPRDVGTDGTGGAAVTAAGVLSDLGVLLDELYGEQP